VSTMILLYHPFLMPYWVRHFMCISWFDMYLIKSRAWYFQTRVLFMASCPGIFH